LLTVSAAPQRALAGFRRLRDLAAEAFALLGTTETAGYPRTVLRSIGKTRSNLKYRATLLGELDDRPVAPDGDAIHVVSSTVRFGPAGGAFGEQRRPGAKATTAHRPPTVG
jgi:hypothetical protein